MGKKKEKLIHVQIREALEADKRTNRWLIDELKNHKIELNDTQMSNRLSGHVEFSWDEAAACVKVLKMDVSETLSITDN